MHTATSITFILTFSKSIQFYISNFWLIDICNLEFRIKALKLSDSYWNFWMCALFFTWLLSFFSFELQLQQCWLLQSIEHTDPAFQFKCVYKWNAQKSKENKQDTALLYCMQYDLHIRVTCCTIFITVIYKRCLSKAGSLNSSVLLFFSFLNVPTSTYVPTAYMHKYIRMIKLVIGVKIKHAQTNELLNS